MWCRPSPLEYQLKLDVTSSGPERGLQTRFVFISSQTYLHGLPQRGAPSAEGYPPGTTRYYPLEPRPLGPGFIRRSTTSRARRVVLTNKYRLSDVAAHLSEAAAEDDTDSQC